MPRVAIAIDAIMSMSHARRSGLLVITRTIGAFGATCIRGEDEYNVHYWGSGANGGGR